MADTQALLGTDSPPIAIGFLDTVPEGIAAWDGPEMPAGCSFWKEAWSGKTFYTTPEDHYNCAVGAHTHRVELPMARASELMDTVGFMVESGYIAMEEVPGIPVLLETPAAVAYGPVDSAPFTPSVVLVALQPAQAMLLYEAVVQAGVSTALMPSLGRPACAVLPLALSSDAAAISLGCKGNRTFTELSEGKLYLCIPGDKWDEVLEHYTKAAQANEIMGNYYTDKKGKFSE